MTYPASDDDVEALSPSIEAVVKRLLNPPFGTETSERLLMGTAADAIRHLAKQEADIRAAYCLRRSENAELVRENKRLDRELEAALSEKQARELEELAKRVEGGEGADRELDLAIITAVYPFALVLKHNRDTGENEPFTYHEPTSSLDSVVALVERMLPGWHADLDVGSPMADGLFGARIFRPNCSPPGNTAGEAKSPARALLAATLRALASTPPKGSDQ